MSGAIGSASEFGLSSSVIGTLVGESALTKQKLDTLTAQESSGYVGDTYAGLGTGAGTSLSLTPEIASNQVYQTNITSAVSVASVAQVALTQLSSIASNFQAQAATLNQLSPPNVDSIAAQAQQALQQVAQLLDTTDNGSYVFSGQDSGNPPIANPNGIASSNFVIAIQSAVAGLTTNGATATEQATLAIAQSNDPSVSPFSAALSQPAAAANALRTTVAIGPDQQTTIGIVASANAYVASTGSDTTGSYTRDLLRGLATLASLSSSQVNDPNFIPLVQDTFSSLGDAVTALNQDAGALGNQQTQLTAQGTELSNVQTALSAQLSSAEDVDLAKTATQISATQTQLTASYQLINEIQSLTLTKYITTG